MIDTELNGDHSDLVPYNFQLPLQKRELITLLASDGGVTQRSKLKYSDYQCRSYSGDIRQILVAGEDDSLPFPRFRLLP